MPSKARQQALLDTKEGRNERRAIGLICFAVTLVASTKSDVCL